MVLLICSASFFAASSRPAPADRFTHRNLLLMAFDPSLNHYSKSQARRALWTPWWSGPGRPGRGERSLASSIPLAMEGTQNSFVPEEGEDG